jgi:hypothetical protein
VDEEGSGPRERGERQDQQQQQDAACGSNSNSNEGHAMSQNEPMPAERYAFRQMQQQQEIQRDVMSSPPQPRQFSPQQQYGRVRDQERPASPVSSCEGGTAAAACAGLKGRVPAEVVFSPLKMGLAGATAAAAQRATPTGGTTTSSGGEGRVGQDASGGSTGSTPLSKPRGAAAV